VAISIADYLIDQSGIDWPKALCSWSWLLPPEFTLWLVNRFGDLFLVLPDDTVHMLDVGGWHADQTCRQPRRFLYQNRRGRQCKPMVNDPAGR
jgi:hypothetical protein